MKTELDSGYFPAAYGSDFEGVFQFLKEKFHDLLEKPETVIHFYQEILIFFQILSHRFSLQQHEHLNLDANSAESEDFSFLR